MRLIARCASIRESTDRDLTPDLAARNSQIGRIRDCGWIGSYWQSTQQKDCSLRLGNKKQIHYRLGNKKQIHYRRNLYLLTLLCLLSDTGRTATGRHHEENSFSDGRYSRIHCTFVRAGQNCRSSAAIRCFLVLLGSGYRNDEMSSCQCAACRWWQNEGYRCRSSDTCICGNSFDGRQDLHQVMR
jgi:hypothetical protein